MAQALRLNPCTSTFSIQSSKRTPTLTTLAYVRRHLSIASCCRTAGACGSLLAMRSNEDVVAVLKHERFVKDQRNALTPEQLAQVPPIPEVMKPLTRNRLDIDPPDHERLRALVSKAFTPRLIEGTYGVMMR